MQATENIPQLRQIGTANVDRLTFEADEIKYLWAAGILNDTAYIGMAIKLDKRKWNSLTEFNTADFIERWLFAGGDDSGLRSKVLTPKSIREAIVKLADAGFIKIEQQLSLELTW